MTLMDWQLIVVYLVVALALVTMARRVWAAAGVRAGKAGAGATPACSQCRCKHKQPEPEDWHQGRHHEHRHLHARHGQGGSALSHHRVGERANALDRHADRVAAAQKDGRIPVQTDAAGCACGDDVAGQ